MSGTGVRFTTVYMPLARTPMTAPVALYRNLPVRSAEQAADLLVRALIERPARITTGLGLVGELVQLLTPRLAQSLMSGTFEALGGDGLGPA